VFQMCAPNESAPRKGVQALGVQTGRQAIVVLCEMVRSHAGKRPQGDSGWVLLNGYTYFRLIPEIIESCSIDSTTVSFMRLMLYLIASS